MRHYNIIVSLFLLVIQILPAFAKSFMDTMELSWSSQQQQQRRSVNGIVEREAWVVVDKQNSNSKRESPTLSTKTSSKVKRAATSSLATAAAEASSFDAAAFNQSATTACSKAVSNYAAAVNPSGIVACYNIAFLDNSTGVFQTDVRLYQKSDATGDFVGVSPSNYSLSMSIAEATLSSPQAMVKGSLTGTEPATGQFLTGFQNIGQMTDTITYSKLTEGDLRVLMIPSISMAAINPKTNTVANTTLASDTLSYVAGQLVQADGTPTNITLPDAIAQASPIVSSVSKFVLPGTVIMVYPTGLIITCIWTGILMLAVGVGTIGRYQFRQHYRQRMQRAQVSGMR